MAKAATRRPTAPHSQRHRQRKKLRKTVKKAAGLLFAAATAQGSGSPLHFLPKRMKIRIQGNSLRLRLSQPEVARFHETGQVADGISFGAVPPVALTYKLERSSLPEMTVGFSDNCISVYVPEEQAATWAGSEQEVGMEQLVRFDGHGGSLRILIEKDFKCLAERPGEDESDNFPNPNLSC